MEKLLKKFQMDLDWQCLNASIEHQHGLLERDYDYQTSDYCDLTSEMIYDADYVIQECIYHCTFKEYCEHMMYYQEDFEVMQEREEMKIRLQQAAMNLDVYVLGHHIEDDKVFEMINEFFIGHKLDRVWRMYFANCLYTLDEIEYENPFPVCWRTQYYHRTYCRWENIHSLIKELL